MYNPGSLTRWKSHLIWIDGNYKIRKLDSSTNQVSTIFGAGNGNSPNSVTDPLLVKTGNCFSMSVDPATDNIYIADQTYSLIRKLDGTTNVASVYKTGVSHTITAKTTFCNGGLYIPIDSTYIIQKLVDNGGGSVSVSTVVGGGDSKTMDIAGTSYQMDSTNFVVYMDCYNNEVYWSSKDSCIRKLTTGGIVQQVLGNGFTGESPDGTVTSSSSNGYVSSFTINQINGDLYFVDNDYNIRKLVGGTLSTLMHYELNERNARTIPLSPSAITKSGDGNGLFMADLYSVKFYNFTSSTIKHYSGYSYLPYDSLAPSGSNNIGGLYVTARYSSIRSISANQSGDVYLGYFIKLLSKGTGLLTVVAGSSSGSECTDGSIATSCQLPSVITNVQSYNGEVYYGSEYAIFKVNSANGIIVKIIGYGSSFTDGAASSANLLTLVFFTIRQSDGNIYYLQRVTSSDKRLRVLASGAVKTLFTITDNTVNYKDFIVDDYGKVYYTSSNNGELQKLNLFTPVSANALTGTVTVFAGNSAGTFNDGETLSNTKFNTFSGLTFASNFNYLIIAESDKLRKIYMECDYNYGGGNCDIPYCYSILSSDPTVCNSHGNCVGVDNCTCFAGYSGSSCSYWTCFEYSKYDTTGCSNHGSCESFNKCSCSSHYYGSNCSVTVCNEKYSNSSQVCSGKGMCLDYNSCVCDSNYYGDDCQNFDCFNVPKTSSIVCSGNGLCTDHDSCSCFENYYESNCSITICNGVFSNSSQVCSGRGSCISANNCSCESGYFGDECQYYNCFEILYNSSEVCSSKGQCLSPNNCSCESGYFGDECQYYNCFEILSNSTQVCSGRGSCISANNCSCESGYFGNECQYYNCFAILSNTSEVCSSKGQCVSPNNCSCESGYFGNECQYYNCFGILSNSTQVCTSRGQCLFPNNCSCNQGYNGDECQFTSCYGKYFNDSMVCSGHGSCRQYNNCSCEIGYIGNDCSLYNCFGILNTNSSVCSGNGNCTLHDTCECYNNFTGVECNITIPENRTILNNSSLNNISTNVNETATSLNNDTLVSNSSITNNSLAFNDTLVGNSSITNTSTVNGTLFNLVSCFGVLNTNISICSGNGNCSSNDTCVCNQNFTGLECNITISDNNTIIIGNISLGNNTFNNSTMNNNTTFNNTNLNETYIFNQTIGNISNTSVNNFTSINDTLVKTNETNTFQNTSSTKTNETNVNPLIEQNYTSSTQNTTCGNNSNLICSGNGNCFNNQCSCNDGYTCSVCELKMCFGIPSNSSKVCNGRGVCSNVNKCDCISGVNSGGDIKIMGDECETMFCKGIYNGVDYFFSEFDSRVCSKHGKCVFNNSSSGCLCNSGYYGDSCNKFDCFSIQSTSSNVCSGHGECISPDNCQCHNNETNGHFAGANCNECHLAFSGLSCKDKTCSVSTCLNGGSCGNENQCVCKSNYTGLICESCKLDHYGENCNVYCKDESTCNGHGNCDLNGTCLCFENREKGYWNGSNCNSCLSDYYGSDCLTHFESFNSSYGSISLVGQVSNYFDGILFKLFGSSSQNSISCSNLIHPNDISLFGSEPKCYWTDKLNGNFKIEFDNDFTFDINKVMSIRLNTNVLSNTLIDHGYINMALILSENIKAPTANIKSARQVYSTYENIYLSALNSFSGDRKALDYYWNITGQGIKLNVLQSIVSTKNQILMIEKGQLTSGTYIISLFVKSQVSKLVSSIESVNIQVQDFELPSISILNKEISVKSTDKFITIKKTTFIPQSLKEKEMKIEWKQIEGPTLIKFTKDSYNNLVIEQLANGKWKYVFNVSIHLVENPWLFSNDMVVINAEQPKLSLSLSLKQLSGIQNSIQVNFQDPENSNDENEVWKWTCIDSSSLGYCGDTIYQNLSFYSHNHSKIIEISQQDFPSYVMSPTFTLDITKGSRSVSSSMSLNIQYSPPIISIISVSPNLKNIVTKNDKISIAMKHPDHDPLDSSLVVKTQWTLNNLLVSESTTKKVKENEIETTSSIIKTPFKNLKSLNKNQQSSLVIDSKELENRVDYSIQVKVSFVDSVANKEIASSSNVNRFTKAVSPRKCQCNISPPIGVSMKTSFTFTCENCQNEDNSIEISQGYIDQDSGIMVYLPLSLDGSVNIPSISSTSLKRELEDHNVQLFIELDDTSTGETNLMYSNITVLPPPQSTLSEIFNLVSNQTSNIQSTSIPDGNTALSIADTLNAIISTTESFKTLPSAEKELSTVTKVQSKLLDTLSSSLQTTGYESISPATASMAVLAVGSVLKNEKVIEKPIIQKSITILNHVTQLSLKSKVDMFSQTSKPFGKIAGILKEQIAKFSQLREEFIRYEQISLTAEQMTLSYVYVQPVSGDPAAIHESIVNVKADKMYLTDFSNSLLISAPLRNSKKRVNNKYQSFVHIPQMKITEINEFAELTYSYIVKEHVPTIYQKYLQQELNNSTTNGTMSLVVSPVSASLSVFSPQSQLIEFPQNLTIFLNIIDSDFSTSLLSEYVCLLFNSDLESDFENCTIADRDNSTESIACNCKFIDLQVSNLIIIKNPISKPVSNQQKQGLKDEILIIIIVSCVVLPVVLLISLIIGIVACCLCYKKKKSKQIHPYAINKELISHTIKKPSKFNDNSIISII